MSVLAMMVLGWLTGGTVEVPCRTKVEPNRLEVTVENVGPEVSKFLVAQGMPPYEFRHVRPDDTVVLAAMFICPLEYVHDCFHAEEVRLEPGEANTFTFDWALPEELKRLAGQTHDGIYETYVERPRPKP